MAVLVLVRMTVSIIMCVRMSVSFLRPIGKRNEDGHTVPRAVADPSNVPYCTCSLGLSIIRGISSLADDIGS